MNSQVYCLPQKYGFNAVQGTSSERYHKQKEYLNQKSSPLYLTIPPTTQPRDALIKEACRRSPGLIVPRGDQSVHQSLRLAFNTQYASEYGLHSVPHLQRRHIPMTHEVTPRPINNLRGRYDPPMETVRHTLGTPANDGDTGCHEWRNLLPSARAYVWGKPMTAIPFWSYVGKRYTLPPVRVFQHDPIHEKQRWDNIKALDCRNELAYGYRRNLPGYTGHVQTVEDVTSQVEVENQASCMVSTVQASYKELPDDFYNHGQTDNVNKHKGPLSRMVTLTHPFNPFTQQSAYSNMGSVDTSPSN